MRSVAACVLSLAAVCAPLQLDGQRPSIARADSLLARGDTTAAMDLLEVAVSNDPRNAAAWHRRGVLAWQLASRDTTAATTIIGARPDRALSRLADSSLRLATTFAPDSARYLIDLGRFRLSSSLASNRGKAKDLFERALALAERAGDRQVVSMATDALGMLHWRRYELRAERRLLGGGPKDATLGGIINDPEALQKFFEKYTPKGVTQEWSGEEEYSAALDLFSRARRTDPGNETAARHAYMALAERARWEELRHLARSRTGTNGDDGWGWLARGLASYRLGAIAEATAAFDRALDVLPDHERRRLTRVSRILRPADSTRYDAMSPEERAAAERFYWLMTDPLWAAAGNERWLEFLSRVVYADLLWSSDDYRIAGSETERGDIYIRYGPPTVMVAFSPDPLLAREHWIRQVWLYREGLAFMFRLPPGYGVAKLGTFSALRARELRDTMPVMFTNVAASRAPDSIPARLARFRATADSADIVVAAEIPLQSLVSGIDLMTVPIRTQLQFFDWRTDRVVHDSSRRTVDAKETGLPASRVRSWQPRVGVGDYFYRIEAIQPDAYRSARGGGRVTVTTDSAFSLTGFGVSDLLIASDVAVDSGPAPRRWSDVRITPSAGALEAATPIWLLWESYGLREQARVNRYQVTVVLERMSGGGVGALAARIVGGIAGAIGLRESGTDRVAIRFTREVPGDSVHLDYLSVDLAGVPPGDYRISVEIDDLLGARRAIRRALVTLRA